MADAKAVRRYQASVERALALFDATNEWADYIAFLSRLLKSLQSPPENADIPLKITVARYLAQCLRPSLPSGVHQKALEVYDFIFSVIGVKGLKRDLTLYLPGLSHTLSFASLSTRPQFLAIYDNHVLALSVTDLRPAVRSLIMSLLPGIEEETSEDFEKTLSTFNHLRQKFVDDHHEEIFWQNLFLASITSPQRRAGVLVYLVRYLPKLVSQSAQQSNGTLQAAEEVVRAVITPEPGLLIRCFATGLQDPQPLVQRGFLDLLVSHLPLDATIFAEGAHINDLDVLVDASTAVVLRRDMSLNRRLWAWYTGSEAKSLLNAQETDARDTAESPTISRSDKKNDNYFAAYGLASLIRSISVMLQYHSEEPAHRARSFRIALSLMDRSEIGGPVVEALFVPLLRNLQLYQETAPSQDTFDEVFRSANVFFDGIDSKLIATQLLLLLEQGELDLVTFIVKNFNLEEEDMTQKHIPLICVVISEDLNAQTTTMEAPDAEQISHASKLGDILEDLLVLVPAGVLRNSQKGQIPRRNLKSQISRILTMRTAVSSSSAESEDLDAEAVCSALLTSIFACLQSCILRPELGGELLGCMLDCMNQCLALTQGFRTLEQIRFLQNLLQNVQDIGTDYGSRQYQIVTGITRLMVTLHINDTSEKALSQADLCALVPTLVAELWYFLLSSKPQYHVEAVESIWRLHGISHSLRLVESTIMSLLIEGLSLPESNEHCMQRFSTLWIHSRVASRQVQSLTTESQSATNDDVLDLLRSPLLQIIDAVDSNATLNPASVWIASLASLNALFLVVFEQTPKDSTDLSNMSIALQRLGKLITLAKTNDAQWKAFTGKSGYRDAVFELCSSLTSNQAIVNTLGVKALNLVRLTIGSDGVELSDDILKMLSTRLVASYGMEQFQDALLDTLQVAFSSTSPPGQPDYLLPILLDGIASPAIDVTLDKWITLLCTIVPLLRTTVLFSHLIAITTCLCKRVDLNFTNLQDIYNDDTQGKDASLNDIDSANPERSISNLLSGMEYVLAKAHHQTSRASDEQNAGLNGANADLPSSRSHANDRLTVVLCMQDALKVCSRLWVWRSTGKSLSVLRDTKSLHYMTSRIRARSRRILENLVEAEPQECLETLMGLWVERRQQNSQHYQILELLQTLDGARPKFMMPAAFNAIYSRTNPGALDQSQRSSLSVNVNAFELIAFLNDYTSALEDDLLEEIWADCTMFLKEVLSNPMPHRQILFKLLEFIAVLCRKMENTNFGEEQRMRKELADLSARLFTAILTIKPQGIDGSGSKSLDIASIFDRKPSLSRSSVQVGNALQILQDTLPDLALVLSQSDRLTTVYTGIATNISGPLLHSRLYPQNVSAELLALLQTMSTSPVAIKSWKKDVTDAFNDNKFFQNQPQLIEPGWLPLLRQLAIVDKTVMTELLARITPPSAAGLMFGVGASAARSEADKKTQFTLRRIGLLLLSTETDYFVPNLQNLLTKLEELLMATPESSPSSNCRSDVYLILRAMLLMFSQSQLSSVWLLIDNELRDLCAAMMNKDSNRFSQSAQLQGAKLLDVLLLMKPDEFQLHEWIFVTDTMDAIYPPHDSRPIALADQIIPESSTTQLDLQAPSTSRAKKPWLCTDDSRDDDKIGSLLTGFFAHLSIRTFETNYSMQKIDLEACREDLINDLFNE